MFCKIKIVFTTYILVHLHTNKAIKKIDEMTQPIFQESNPIRYIVQYKCYIEAISFFVDTNIAFLGEVQHQGHKTFSVLIYKPISLCYWNERKIPYGTAKFLRH